MMKPAPPKGRLIREGALLICPACGSSMLRRWIFIGRAKCINPECGRSRAYDEVAELHARILDIVNRRVVVEQVLLDAANGKRALPTREECRELAAKLGVPSRYA